MEKDIHTKLKEMRENTKLSDQEKAGHRAEILRRIESQPSPYAPLKKISPFYISLVFRRHLILTSILLVFTLGGGLTLSANGSLPSDFLYRVKTNVTEPIALFFTPTSAGKASMKVALVNKRLQEFSKVTLNKNLNQKDKINFVNRISGQIKDTQKEILQLAEEKNASGAFRANNNLQSILATQDIILDKIYATNPEADDTNDFTSIINMSMKENIQIENQITDSISASEDETDIDRTIDGLKKEINISLKKIERAKQEFLKEKTDTLDVIDQKSLNTAISDIYEDLELAGEKATKESKQESLRRYNAIDRDLGKLRSLMQTKKQVRLEIKN